MKTVTKFFGKTISGPFTIPSGIVTTDVSIIERIANDIPQIGILTTKSISLLPKEGNREPIISQFPNGSVINAVGLANPGVEAFAKRLKRLTLPEGKFLLISIFGKDEYEFEKTAERLLPYADGFELNISCPHSEMYGQAIGQDLSLVERIIKKVLQFKKPVVVKVSPNLDIKETVLHCLSAGASGFTAINTKGPVVYKQWGHPVLTNKAGGVSGKDILKTGISCVRKIRSMTDVPIIGVGGIQSRHDVLQYKKAGADYFGIGSSLIGMDTETLKRYFHELEKDLSRNTNHAAKFVCKDPQMKFYRYKIVRNIEVTKDYHLIQFESEFLVTPGQFVFLWLPGEGEKPFSVLDTHPMTIFVKKKGCFTDTLSKLREGDTIFVRGPYGNFPQINGKVLIAGAGTGAAALYLFAKEHWDTVAVLGAKCAAGIPYREQFEKACRKVYVATSNGELGHHGRITSILDAIIRKEKPRYCINCGPEDMVHESIAIEEKYIARHRIYSSIEFVTKCGVGLCGRCATSKGYRNCVDGTFFSPEKI